MLIAMNSLRSIYVTIFIACVGILPPLSFAHAEQIKNISIPSESVHDIDYLAPEHNDKILTLKSLALNGSLESQIKLAHIYSYGARNNEDLEETFRWSKMAALQGDNKSQYRVGYAYHIGVGTEENVAKAHEWLLKSAKQGNVRAFERLGQIHLWEVGYRDPIESYAWFLTARQNGYNSDSAIGLLESQLTSEQKEKAHNKANSYHQLYSATNQK